MATDKKVSGVVAAKASAEAVTSAEALAAVVAAGDAALPKDVIAGAGASGADTLTAERLVNEALAAGRSLAETIADTRATELVLDEALPDAPASAALAGITFPFEVTLSNNGGFAVSDPVSGAFLPAGGSQTVWLHDEAHASRVRDSLCELAKRNNLVDALLVNGRPLLDNDD